MRDGKRKTVSPFRNPLHAVGLSLLALVTAVCVVFALYTVVLSFLSVAKSDETAQTLGDMTQKPTFVPDDGSNEIAQALSFDYNLVCMANELSWLDME